MYTVYVLQDKNGKSYKGMTNNLQRRFAEHTQGHTKTTRQIEELKIVYTEDFSERTQARQREKYLKSAAGRRFLKTILENMDR